MFNTWESQSESETGPKEILATGKNRGDFLEIGQGESRVRPQFAAMAGLRDAARGPRAADGVEPGEGCA